MKRLGWMAVLGAMLFATGAQADGIDLKVKGQWDFAFGWASRLEDGAAGKNRGDRRDDKFYALQRVRTQINFITSEYLQGVLMFEIGDIHWGMNDNGKSGPGSGGVLDADGVNVETKRAYLDWIIPETEITVRMGIQGISLPMANGYDNPVMSADMAGIVINTPINDMFGLTAFWMRPWNRTLNDAEWASDNLADEMDVFGLVLPITGDGWSVTPWGMYSRIGNAAEYYEYFDVDYAHLNTGTSHDIEENEGTNAWWAGISAEVDMFDPLTFGFDFMYGHLGKTEIGLFNPASRGGFSEFGTCGWFFAAALNYELDFMTPGIFGWYASGDDYDDVKDGQFGRLPIIGNDDGFAVTSFGFPGTYSIGTDSAVGTTGAGTWGVGIQFADISFIEDLTHVVRLAYYRGTNDSDVIKKGFGGSDDDMPYTGGEGQYLTTKDWALEVNFDHEYQIYENLTAIVELGYIHLKMDDDVWDETRNNNAWKAQLLFNYSF